MTFFESQKSETTMYYKERHLSTCRQIQTSNIVNFSPMTDYHRIIGEPKIIKGNNNNLQLYARAKAPCRDYYGLTITESSLTLNIWRISYGPHMMPKQKNYNFEDFKYDKPFQDEIKEVFGIGVFDYLTGLSRKQRKLENLPSKLFLYLMRFLYMEDVLRLMCCSKILFELCNQEEVWRIMFIKKFGRIPSKEEKLLAIDSSWKEVFKKRLAYVRKALKESNERKLKKKMEMQRATRKAPRV